MENNFLRAKVINSKDPSKFGRVLVWIPDLMPLISDDQGIWARPANNFLGGRNEESFKDQNYMGSCFIPQKGSWVFIFFELGNPNFPYYISSLDIENTKVLPECQIDNYDNKWVIFKSHSGRCIVISDDPKDSRVEITGKKRKIKNPPSGDTDSVYTIDENQTSILLDERDGKEKVLIRSHKGDFLHFDVDQRQLHALFKSDIHIKSEGDIFISGKNINITSQDDIKLKASDDVSIKGNNVNSEAFDSINSKAGMKLNNQSGGTLSNKATISVSNDGTLVLDNSGSSIPAKSAKSAKEAKPKGDRDT